MWFGTALECASCDGATQEWTVCQSSQVSGDTHWTVQRESIGTNNRTVADDNNV